MEIQDWTRGDWIALGVTIAIVAGIIAAFLLGGLWWGLGVIGTLIAILIGLFLLGMRNARYA